VAVALAVGLILAGCGQDDGGAVRTIDPTGSETGTGSGTGTGVAGDCEPVGGATSDNEVHVTLVEYAIQIRAGEESVPAGRVTFEAANDGAEPHELVVVRASSPDDLPRADDGSFDEAAMPAADVIGEIEPFAPEAGCLATFDLTPGDYLLLCNIVEHGAGHSEVEGHLELGMVTPLTVT